MSYSYRIFSSMEEVDLAAWDAVRAPGGNLFTDARFISAVENSMGSQAQCWPVIVEDETGQAAAVTCLSLLRVDGALFTGLWLKRLVQSTRWLWPRFLRFRILFCGVPVSVGQEALCIAPHADRGQVLQAIDAALCELAQRLRVWLIVWKEFGPEDCRWLAPLKERGYFQADSLPMNHFEPRFTDFEQYLSARRSKSRHNILRSRRKLRDAGLRAVRMRGDEGFDRLYSDEVHRLYDAVWERADSRLERLPAEFFREIARRFGKDAGFTVIYQGERIVAFSCNLADKQRFHMLFMGMDYQLNDQCDLYFNVIYADLACGLRSGVSDICFGQASPAFKARIGCYQRPLALFVKGRGMLRPLLWTFAGMFFPPQEILPPPEVFRSAKNGKIPSPSRLPPKP